VQIIDGGNDFLTNSAVVSFADGVSSSTATIVARDDNLPEGNETFSLMIVNARNGAIVGLRDTMTLIIQASDEPFGTIQFAPVSIIIHSLFIIIHSTIHYSCYCSILSCVFVQGSLAVSVAEPLSTSTAVQLTVTRGPGVFGQVTVDYQVRKPCIYTYRSIHLSYSYMCISTCMYVG